MFENKILVSVIVCCYNEEEYIEKCIGSLLNQKNVNGDLEILVIDGNSTDKTKQILERMAADSDRLRLFDNPARVKPPAVNTGFINSRGEYIAICDAHTIYDENYISSCLKLMQEHPDVWCVGGPIISLGKTSFGKANAVAMSSPIGIGNAKHRFPDFEGYAEMACFPMFRRIVLDKIGLYDEKFVINHDSEYCYRMRKAGGKVYLSPIARSYYHVRNNPAKLFKQYFNYGMYQIATLKKHKMPISFRQLVPFSFFLVMILLFLLAFITGNIVVGMILPAAYLLSLTAAGIWVGLKHGIMIGLNFPIAAFTLHLSYACGFACGLIKFNFFTKVS